MSVIEFRKISSIDPVVDYLSRAISESLEVGKRVLWLVPGGSSIAIAAQVAKQLEGHDLSRLIVTLTDERYGEVGHPDSNWQQLMEAGFLLPGATMQPVLTGIDMVTTVNNFATALKEDLASADYGVGFFGIGPDGHTAGMLPHSPALAETELVHGYTAGPFKRITMTAPAIAKLTQAVVYAAGEAKWPVIDEFESNIPIDDQPAQILKQVPKLIIFNDHKGEEA